MTRLAWAWIMLVSAGLLEIIWAVALKYSHGFTRFWPSIVGITFALLSFIMLSFSMKSLPIGTAYAVWVGVGTLGVAIAGIVALGESISPLRMASLVLVILGIIGLKLFEK
ncbi:quaternary ammonium compound efflux SMR transporter SugE [Paenibacillus mesophilus]|uniref:quaternary ammonium compound efflux SMR transporter SugE n=1 Tax=Paenibacillus mesophilus TaxID=2582849 RepID=UPI00110E580C|nr:quaternary ammonium compound efflux SMR transporter SugE [Paenibacillus mesophilus]TMV48368.1 quaternary ammonium compound efflux SMR transporter SugE [Paenibacillus mesophilus]